MSHPQTGPGNSFCEFRYSESLSPPLILVVHIPEGHFFKLLWLRLLFVCISGDRCTRYLHSNFLLEKQMLLCLRAMGSLMKEQENGELFTRGHYNPDITMENMRSKAQCLVKCLINRPRVNSWLSLLSCVTSCKSLNLSEPQRPPLPSGDNNSAPGDY